MCMYNHIPVLPIVSLLQGKAVHSSLCCTTAFDIFFHSSLLLAFLSTFLLSVQFLNESTDLVVDSNISNE